MLQYLGQNTPNTDQSPSYLNFYSLKALSSIQRGREIGMSAAKPTRSVKRPWSMKYGELWCQACSKLLGPRSGCGKDNSFKCSGFHVLGSQSKSRYRLCSTMTKSSHLRIHSFMYKYCCTWASHLFSSNRRSVLFEILYLATIFEQSRE